MKEFSKKLFPLLFVALTACAVPRQAPQNAANAEPAATGGRETSDVDAPQHEACRPLDASAMTPKSVDVYNSGCDAFVLDDILPLLSDASFYNQKWEFYIYSRPYETRIKFEISNFAFSKNEGKLKGYVKKFDGDKETANYPIEKTLKNGQWSASQDGLRLDFGDYALTFENNAFRVTGVFDEGNGSFDYIVPVHAWKPGTGNVFFGNSEENVFKYSILTYQMPIGKSEIRHNGETVPVAGLAYGNHYAATVAVYDMFDEVADSRIHSDGIFVEFRYYVPSAKYDAQPFGFLIAAFRGTPLVAAKEIKRTSLETWVDDKFYGYQIDSRQLIEARDADNPQNTATLRMTRAVPTPIDSYAALPAFQRNIAKRFAKPIEYSIPIEYELTVEADGYKAKIPISSKNTITRLR